MRSSPSRSLRSTSRRATCRTTGSLNSSYVVFLSIESCRPCFSVLRMRSRKLWNSTSPPNKVIWDGEQVPKIPSDTCLHPSHYSDFSSRHQEQDEVPGFKVCRSCFRDHLCAVFLDLLCAVVIQSGVASWDPTRTGGGSITITFVLSCPRRISC